MQERMVHVPAGEDVHAGEDGACRRGWCMQERMAHALVGEDGACRRGWYMHDGMVHAG